MDVVRKGFMLPGVEYAAHYNCCSNTNDNDGRFQGRIIRALANSSGVYQYSCHLCTLSSPSIAAVLYVLIQGPLTRGGRSSFGSTSECYSNVV